jgi:16S rRNA (guanine527-N7)-methyltransferase
VDGAVTLGDGAAPADDVEQDAVEQDAVEQDAVEQEPPAAAAIFGDALPVARRYVQLLAGPGTVRGLIGPREAGRLWTRHVLNCAVAADVIPLGSRVVDIGSGAGLPGIPMAIARPDVAVDLVESLLRRTAFLEEAVAELGLTDRCRVIRTRAEDAVDQVGGADAVTARAVAPLARLARWAAPLLRDGGLFAAVKGSTAHEELVRDRAACRRAGIADLEVREVGGDRLVEPTTVIIGRRSTSR